VSNNARLHKRLYYLAEQASYPFIPLLLDSLMPIKTIRCRKKLYPVEWVDEIMWLQHCCPELEVDVIILQSTNNVDVVKKALHQRQYLRYLDDVSSKDLYGLEQIWQSTSSYSPLLSQKDYTAMLGCNRSSLNRHYSTLLTAQETSPQQCIVSIPDTTNRHFSWEQNTEHIPSLMPDELPSVQSSDISSDD
jgi:hypothetical protein